MSNDNGVKVYASKDDLKNADWNQNDETQIDYIKNRPFYEGIEEIVYADEQTVTFEKYNNSSKGNVSLNNINSTPDFNYNGQIYKIIFDGIVYLCTSYGGYWLEDYCLCLKIINEDDIEIIFYDLNLVVAYSEKIIGEHTIKISKLKTTVNKLDDKYLSDNVITKNNISFNDAGELVVTINGVSKVFAPKEATTLAVDESTGILKVGTTTTSTE